MRTVTLILPDDQFVDLFSFTKGYLASNSNENSFAEMMQNVHDQCDIQASDDERDAINAQIDRMRNVFTEDSPEKYIAVAGMKGLIEKATEKL